jgi:hypothetical protein
VPDSSCPRIAPYLAGREIESLSRLDLAGATVPTLGGHYERPSAPCVFRSVFILCAAAHRAADCRNSSRCVRITFGSQCLCTGQPGFAAAFGEVGRAAGRADRTTARATRYVPYALQAGDAETLVGKPASAFAPAGKGAPSATVVLDTAAATSSATTVQPLAIRHRRSARRWVQFVWPRNRLHALRRKPAAERPAYRSRGASGASTDAREG